MGMAGLWGLTVPSAEASVDETSLPDSIDVVATVDDMQRVDPSVEALLYVQGYHRSGDGGGGLFGWAPDASQEPDEGVTFVPEGASYGSGEKRGRWVRQWQGHRVNVRWFGARADLEWARNVSISAGSRRATTQTASFSSEDAGKSFVLNGEENQVVASIRRVVNRSTVELDRPSPVTIRNMVASWGTDDAPAFNRAIAFANPTPVKEGGLATHKEVPSYGIFVPDGDYLVATPIRLREGVTLIGASTMGTRLNLSYAENGGDHRIRSYFHSNKSALYTGTHAEYQKNFGLEHLGLRPRPGERNPGDNQKFVHIKFGIEFVIENVRISMHNSPFKGAPWHVIGVQLEKNIDPSFDGVNFENGQYGLRLMEPTEDVAKEERFGVRGGRFNNLYFYDQKRRSCEAKNIRNTQVGNVMCKYVQDYGYEDRTAFTIAPGRDGTPSREIQLTSISVNGYRSSAQLSYGMVLHGDRMQVTGCSVRKTDKEGIVIGGGEGTMVSSTSVAFTGGHGIEVQEDATDLLVSSVSVRKTRGCGVQVNGEAVLAHVQGAKNHQGISGGKGKIMRAARKNTSDEAKSGGASQRPENPEVGTVYFDTSLGQPVWWRGDRWVDADGHPVSS